MPIKIRAEGRLQYIPKNMHTVFALPCLFVVIHWLIFPYPSGLLHWHCGNLTIVPVLAKQPWWIWINTSCEFIMNDCITTTKQSRTKPCAYFLGYTVYVVCEMAWTGSRQISPNIRAKCNHQVTVCCRKIFSTHRWPRNLSCNTTDGSLVDVGIVGGPLVRRKHPWNIHLTSLKGHLNTTVRRIFMLSLEKVFLIPLTMQKLLVSMCTFSSNMN